MRGLFRRRAAAPDQPRRTRRLLAATAAVAVAAGGALGGVALTMPAAGPAPAATAAAAVRAADFGAEAATYPAQGGCTPHYQVAGFDIGVCINDRGTGTTAYPDIYVNRVGAHTGACSIGIELWDNDNHRYGTTTQAPCTPGHHLGAAYGPVKSPLTLHAFARLATNGRSYYLGNGLGDSPSVALGPPHFSQPLYRWDIPLTYTRAAYHVVLTEEVRGTVPAVFQELHRCFNCNFPVPGAPAAYPAFGELLHLYDVFGAVQAPVRAYPYDANGYLLYVAQNGHFDGAGSTVQFTFTRDGNGILHLVVTAHAVDDTFLQFLSKGGAAVRWHQFAAQLGQNMVAHNEGTPVFGG